MDPRPHHHPALALGAGALLLVVCFGIGWLLARDFVTPWLVPPAHKEAHHA